MSAPRSKLSAIFSGSFAGLLAVVILLMVPVLGVRKQVSLLTLNWQELVLYISCLVAGTISGARVGIRESQSIMLSGTAELSEQSTLPSSDLQPDDSDEGLETLEPVGASVQECSTVEAPNNLADGAKLQNDEADTHADVSRNDPLDLEPPLTVPPIEESLAGGPRKPPRKFWTEASKSRTRVLLLFLYLLLYVMCAVLCQKINLGNIVTDVLTAEIIRNVGLGLSVTGLYLMVRGMFVKVASSSIALVSETAELNIGGWSPRQSPHVPPSRLQFLRTHPVCAGWLVLLTGLPLVYQAWFPLIAIPGLFVGMNWLFAERSPVGGDLAVAG